MEQLREMPVAPSTTTVPDLPPLTEAPTDAARVAEAARADAAAVPLAPTTVTLTVKTTAGHQTTIVATPDTTMAEVMTHACRDLGVDATAAGQYLLVTEGQVIADGTKTLRDVVGERLDALNARIVKRPEAGVPCPS